MQREFRPQDEDEAAWSRQDTMLLAGFLLGAFVFFGAMFYALGLGRDTTQLADAVPPAITGERVPIVPRLQ